MGKGRDVTKRVCNVAKHIRCLDRRTEKYAPKNRGPGGGGAQKKKKTKKMNVVPDLKRERNDWSIGPAPHVEKTEMGMRNNPVVPRKRDQVKGVGWVAADGWGMERSGSSGRRGPRPIMGC